MLLGCLIAHHPIAQFSGLFLERIDGRDDYRLIRRLLFPSDKYASNISGDDHSLIIANAPGSLNPIPALVSPIDVPVIVWYMAYPSSKRNSSLVGIRKRHLQRGT